MAIHNILQLMYFVFNLKNVLCGNVLFKYVIIKSNLIQSYHICIPPTPLHQLCFSLLWQQQSVTWIRLPC